MYLVWNEKGAADPPAEDLLIAKGEQPMTPEVARRYQSKVDKIEGNIASALQKQAAKLMVSYPCLFSTFLTSNQEPWDQNHFEELLAKWIASCDQPFSVVLEPEFRALLNYVHYHSGRVLRIPGPKAVRT
jgi:hypothetical protein